VAGLDSLSLPSICADSVTPKATLPGGIYSIFILRESGCPFFYRIYDSRGAESDPAILSGFFTALSLFAHEVTAGQLETMTAGSCRYTFQNLRGGLLVLISAKEFDSATLERIIKRITKLIVTRYTSKLAEHQPASLCAPALGESIERIVGEAGVAEARETTQ
jgi:hypothetical protein